MTDPARTFDAATYAENAAFVPALGATILGWLDPRPGERILDLGAGDGVLTEALVRRGAGVVAVDASPSMVEAARARGLDARVGDGESLAFDRAFDAVFSNAALHWMRRPGAVARGVFRALTPGGRFVAECGGHGNCAAVRVALHAALERGGAPVEGVDPWYFPTPEGYRRVLEGAGFVVDELALVARPTALPTGFRGWIATFGAAHLARLPEAAREEAIAYVERRLAGVLVDEEGRAIADYVRLRVRAHRPVG
jgi:SAM-dependent methyltransferase